jgi:hypothetical protein
MNENIAQEILHELFSSLEALETQSTAVLRFLTDNGIANEKKLAPYLEQAGNASSVRWRAVRARIDYLLSSSMKTDEDARKGSPPQGDSPKSPENSQEPRITNTETSRKEETEEARNDTPRAQEATADNNPKVNDTGATAEKEAKQEGEEADGTSKPAAKNAA